MRNARTKGGAMYIRYCWHCGQKFQWKKGMWGRYCSAICVSNARKAKGINIKLGSASPIDKEGICVVCGEGFVYKFYQLNDEKKYCGKRCKHRAMHARQQCRRRNEAYLKPDVNCRFCDAILPKGRGKYCSDLCSRKWSAKNRINKPCEKCSGSFPYSNVRNGLCGKCRMAINQSVVIEKKCAFCDEAFQAKGIMRNKMAYCTKHCAYNAAKRRQTKRKLEIEIKCAAMLAGAQHQLVIKGDLECSTLSAEIYMPMYWQNSGRCLQSSSDRSLPMV